MSLSVLWSILASWCSFTFYNKKKQETLLCCCWGVGFGTVMEGNKMRECFIDHILPSLPPHFSDLISQETFRTGLAHSPCIVSVWIIMPGVPCLSSTNFLCCIVLTEVTHF